MTYHVFYNGKKAEIQAENLYAAKVAAISLFKVPKRKQGLVAVVLASRAVAPESL